MKINVESYKQMIVFNIMIIIFLFPITLLSQSYYYTTDSGCKYYDKDNISGITSSWTGDCVDGNVDGVGTMSVYRNGNLIGIVKAKYSAGWLVKQYSARYFLVTDYDQWFNGLIICFRRADDFTAETLIYGYPGNNEEYTSRIQSVALMGVLTWVLSAASNSNEGREFAENYLLKGTPFMRWYLKRAQNVLDQQELDNLMTKIGY